MHINGRNKTYGSFQFSHLHFTDCQTREKLCTSIPRTEENTNSVLFSCVESEKRIISLLSWHAQTKKREKQGEDTTTREEQTSGMFLSRCRHLRSHYSLARDVADCSDKHLYHSAKGLMLAATNRKRTYS